MTFAATFARLSASSLFSVATDTDGLLGAGATATAGAASSRYGSATKGGAEELESSETPASTAGSQKNLLGVVDSS